MDVTHIALPYGLQAWALPFLLGLGLAAATGLKIFLPLLALAAAIHFHLFGVQVSDQVAWLGSWQALAALGVATVAELIADKFAAAAWVLDKVRVVARPFAAALAAFAVLGRFDPLTAALAGLILGAPAALIFGAVQDGRIGAKGRGDKAFRAGHALAAFIEDALVVAAVLTAFLAPALIPEALVGILAALMLMWWLLGRYKRRAMRQERRLSATPLNLAG